jgi:hypothetical protein
VRKREKKIEGKRKTKKKKSPSPHPTGGNKGQEKTKVSLRSLLHASLSLAPHCLPVTFSNI